MLKMIIVDDEKKIRESMKNCVDWEGLGIQLIGLCKNGMEAYDMILDESPDIVLTDIKMPALSGLELISRITQTGQHVEFIILSGYGEFAYTKEAMKYGIKHYLLKPCNEEELVTVVKEAANSSLEWKEKQNANQLSSNVLKGFKESVFQNFLVECLCQNKDALAAVKQNEHYLNFLNGGYEMTQMVNSDENQRSLIMDVLSCWQKDQASDYAMYCIYAGTRIFLLHEASFFGQEKQQEYLNSKLSMCKVEKNIGFQGFEQMIIYLRKQIPDTSDIKYLNGGRWVSLYIHKEADTPPTFTKDKRAASTGKDFIDQTVQYVYDHLSNPELSLKLIAETYLYMNVDYLSKQFLKYMGCKFSAFLANARIEEAKRLLVSRKDITVQEVAEAVGCGKNPQYFSLLFKKHSGLTATDYTKKMRNP